VKARGTDWTVFCSMASLTTIAAEIVDAVKKTFFHCQLISATGYKLYLDCTVSGECWSLESGSWSTRQDRGRQSQGGGGMRS